MSESAERFLSAAQLARVECLRAAREVLVAKTITNAGALPFQGSSTRSTAPDPIDLVNIARYVEVGGDPYEVIEDAPIVEEEP